MTREEYQLKRKAWLRMLDVIVIVSVMMNFSAVLITNSLVPVNTPLAEGNPVMAKVGGYQTSSNAYKLYVQLLFVSLIWTVLLAAYFYLRINVESDRALIIFSTIVAFWFLALGRDFFGDLGFWIRGLI